MKFDFRIVGSDSHGGVAIRGIAGENNLPWQGYVIFDHPIIKLTRGIVRWPKAKFSTGTALWVDHAEYVSPLTELVLSAQDWNSMEVTVRGEHCWANVRGVPVVDLKLDPGKTSTFVPALARSKGKVGFQINNGEIRLRNVEIKELTHGDPVNSAVKANPLDRLTAGSVWKGTRSYRKGVLMGNKVAYEVHIRERQGSKFKGHKFDNGPKTNRVELEGEVNGNSIKWVEQNPDDSNNAFAMTMTGTITNDTIDVKFVGTVSKGWTSEGDAHLSYLKHE
jgi:hypothetical protein